jgi:hypothetical protein
MPMNLPENSENDGATLKYHDYTNTKNSYSIAVAFVDSKLFFFADRSCFFFGDCIVGTCNIQAALMTLSLGLRRHMYMTFSHTTTSINIASRLRIKLL